MYSVSPVPRSLSPTPRSLLELGSGAGLTGVVVCRSCSPARYTFSDCHPCVLRRLRNNVQQNGLGVPGGPHVAVEELDWAAVTDERLQQLHADTVIAAGARHSNDGGGGCFRRPAKPFYL